MVSCPAPVFIDEIMDRFVYTQILANNLFVSADNMGLDSFIFQHDNDPKHTSKFVKGFLIDNNVRVLEWPAQSPDLNPIEHVWGLIKYKMNGIVHKNKNDLKASITRFWNEITPEECNKLIRTMPKRIREVLLAHGGHTSY